MLRMDVYSLNPFNNRAELLQYLFPEIDVENAVLIPLTTGLNYYVFAPNRNTRQAVLIPLTTGLNYYYNPEKLSFVEIDVLIPLTTGLNYYDEK